ncbi:nuclear receptor-binding factor 2-like [Anopheles maculipalpis]|uniref:nuclear receptor-binding factor 2-like n=1 Tax=Anopheles maculipalpis TaxID=1496333 RepID=UPI002158CD99|nr:nuclear receptor-binding factor 2-like [Anopheles maculipalpis]
MYGRRAENCAKNRRFDDAIDCHRKAVSHFNEALKLQTNAIVQDSLQLQRKYHLKQVDWLLVRKQQYDRYLRALDYQRRKNPEFLVQQIEKMDKYNELQVAIYHNLDDTDGLLETLSRNITTNNPALGISANAAAAGGGGGTKTVNELIALNHSLHILIQRMSQNVDEYATENEELREKLRYYEREAKETGSADGAKGADADPSTNTGKVRGHGGTQQHTGGTLMHDNLSTLAPLEMPVFDLSDFDNH